MDLGQCKNEPADDTMGFNAVAILVRLVANGTWCAAYERTESDLGHPICSLVAL